MLLLETVKQIPLLYRASPEFLNSMWMNRRQFQSQSAPGVSFSQIPAPNFLSAYKLRLVLRNLLSSSQGADSIDFEVVFYANHWRKWWTCSRSRMCKLRCRAMSWPNYDQTVCKTLYTSLHRSLFQKHLDIDWALLSTLRKVSQFVLVSDVISLSNRLTI